MQVLNYLYWMKSFFKVHFSRNVKWIFQEPYKINFDITYLCNSRCRNCNIWQKYRRNPEPLAKEMSASEYDQIFKRISPSLFFVSFEGGEPFLKRDAEEIFKSCLKRADKLISFLIATNGSLPQRAEKTAREILKINSSASLYFSISLDGFEETHNRLRGIPNGYQLALETYERLCSIGDHRLRPFFQYTLCQSNWKEALSFYKRMPKSTVFTLYHHSPLFCNEDSTDGLMTPEEKEEFLSVLSQLMKACRMESPLDFLKKSYLRNSLSFIRKGKNPIPCYAGFATLSSDPYGNIRPCAFFTESFGNLRNSDYFLKPLLSSGEADEIKRKVKNNSCPPCWMNCDALPSLLHDFPRPVWEHFKGRGVIR